MPYIIKIVVFESQDGKKFYEKKLVNDDGKELKCPLKRIALSASEPVAWGKNDIPPDADCTDNCVLWHTLCDIENTFPREDKGKRVKE